MRVLVLMRRPAQIAICLLLAVIASGASAAPSKTSKKTKARPAATQATPAAATVVPPKATTVTAPAAATVPADPALAPLQTVSGMAEAGAPHLALQIMDRDQPGTAGDSAVWMAWERERIYIYQSSWDWRAVIDRMDKLPKDATPDFRTWESMQAADAWLHLGDGGKALGLVQPLIWGAADDRSLAALRELLIRSYTVMGRLDDAQTAVIRYRQDYPQSAGDWPLLEARLFLRLGQPDSALDVLDDVTGDEAQMLTLLASLRNNETTPGDAMGQAVAIGTDSKASIQKRVWAWIIAAEAADDLKNPVANIEALQNALGLQSVLIEQDDVFKLDPDSLWDAYINYGEDLGNQLQLVVGDDQAWFVAASNQYDSSPVNAAALMAVVAYDVQGSTNAAGGMEPGAAKGEQQKQAGVAQGQFAALIQRQRFGDVVLRHLYLDSKRFAGPQGVPPEVRYILVDDVLQEPDIPMASQLMQGLDSAPPPPADAKGYDAAAADAQWQLKRAHVFILGGDPAAGVAALHKVIDPVAQPAPAAGTAAAAAPATAPKPSYDVDDVLQVLFDLQTLHHDKEAIPLFEELLQQPLAPEQKRQMLYWTADSYKATGDYSKAAELYLRSAMQPGPFSMDQWAQTARYQAAQMLAKAGYLEDARNLYNGLLSATRDPAQQAVLQHDLQQLMLLPAKPGSELH